MRITLSVSLLIIALSSFTLIGACSKTTGPSKGTIIITVLDEEGAPLINVTLTLDPLDIERTTDSEGVAIFSEIAAGEYSVTAALTGYDDHQISVLVEGGKTTERTINLLLTKGTLVFIVHDDDSLPVIGVTVTIQPEGTSQTTDSDARAVFENCPPGVHSYLIEGTHFDDVTGSVTVIPDETVTENITLEFMKGFLAVYVRESFVDSAVANAWIKVERTDGVPTIDDQVDENGRWTSPEMRAGTATVSVPAHYRLEGDQKEAQIYGDQTTDVTLRMNRTHSILSGYITLAAGTEFVLYDHPVGLYKGSDPMGIFELVESTTTQSYYSLETDENAYLAAILWSEYSGSELYICWTPIVDARGGHLRVDCPRLLNYISSPNPEGTSFPIDTAFPVKIMLDYPPDQAIIEAWSVWVLEWNYSNDDWDWELSWYSEETDMDQETYWDGVFNEGSYSGQTAFVDDEDHWYVWDCAILYSDGRFSLSFSYPFSFVESTGITRTAAGNPRKKPGALYRMSRDALIRPRIRH